MKGRWTLVALIASVALNLFLLGAGAAVVVIGAKVAHQRAQMAATRPLPALRRAAMALPADQRRTFVGAVRTAAQSQRANNQQARALRDEAWTSLGGATVDTAAIKAKLGQARTIETGVREKIEDALVDTTAALPQAQRAAVGAALRPPARLAQPIPAGK